MSRNSKNKAKIKQQIYELKLKKRNGFMRCIAAIVGFAVLIVIKISLSSNGVEWASTTVANAIFFIMALVAAGFAGLGSRDWRHARDEILALNQKLHK
ncbi:MULTISPECIES: hypothetical protein [unclassified Adlercreutzia]|uniref:hypothetical protein n=1 Tax=unclassified Adlercreutzia TaxID=2636013 RepID=UPI0013EBAB8B|nr:MULTISPECIES: hypothetical protein [unclassified Adlercreutzia]